MGKCKTKTIQSNVISSINLVKVNKKAYGSSHSDMFLDIGVLQIKSLQYNCKGVHFLMKMQARSTLFRIFILSFLVHLFLRTTFNGFWKWDTKYFTLAHQNTFYSFFSFSPICLLLICVLSVCIFKNVSRMFQHVLKWSAEEAATICLKSLSKLVTAEVKQITKFVLIYSC